MKICLIFAYLLNCISCVFVRSTAVFCLTTLTVCIGTADGIYCGVRTERLVIVHE